MAEVVAARLDLAETSQARVKVHEDAVKQAGEWEEVVKGVLQGRSVDTWRSGEGAGLRHGMPDCPCKGQSPE